MTIFKDVLMSVVGLFAVFVVVDTVWAWRQTGKEEAHDDDEWWNCF